MNKLVVLIAAALVAFILLAKGSQLGPATVLTIVVEDPLLTEGGTVVMLVTRLSRSTFDERHGRAIRAEGTEGSLRATADSVVTFVEVEAPPAFKYRFQTRGGAPVDARQVSVSEGGGYLDTTTGQFAASDVTFHHHVAGTRSDEPTSRALLGSFFRIDPATCRVQPAVRVCSGSAAELGEMRQQFERSADP